MVAPMLGRKLQNWLDSHGLGAIALAVLIIAFGLSTLIFGIFYLSAR